MFTRRFDILWGIWRGRQGYFECLSQWWEVGKAQFCLLSAVHHQLTIQVKRAIKDLEGEIRDLDDSFCTHTSMERHTETKVKGTEHVFVGNGERGFVEGQGS